MTNNLEYYKVFYYVAISESLTRAAEKLMISQPAVSQAIKQLESGIGTKLFARTSKGVRLTQAGEILFSYVAKGYEQIELGESQILKMQDMESGEVRIGASDMTLQFFLLPYLERFHEQYPGIKVSVSNAPTPETLKLLSDGKIDFGVVSTPFSGSDTLDCRVVRQIEDVFIAGRRFIPYKNHMMDLQELEKLPIICLEGNTSTRRYMDQYLANNGVKINPEFELATSDMIVQFCLRNLGIGCVVKDFAQTYLDSGKLFELRFNKIIPKRNFCVITEQKNVISIAAKNLLKIIL